MTRKNKAILTATSVLLIIAGVVLLLINKPHRRAEDEKGIAITAAQLVQAYQNDEGAANKQYLNKTLKIKGTVKEAGTNQAGQPTLLFESDDPMAAVFCTMRDKKAAAVAGQAVSVKGFCSGYTTDVLLTDCILISE